MKLITRYLIALVGLAMLTMGAQAQLSSQPYYRLQTLLSSAVCNASQTSNYTAYVTTTRAESIAVAVAFKLNGAGTGNVTFTFRESIDGTTIPTASAAKTIVVAATGATEASYVTNWTVGSAGAWHLVSIVNANADRDVTNMTVKAACKYIVPRN